MKHAVVIGGSMGGLLAARVLSERFQRVTIIERDKFPDGAEPRRGVPQGRHTHALLVSGRNVIEELFPGISGTLAEAGGLLGDVLNDSRWFFEGGCLARMPSELDGLLISRPTLEGAVRERTLALPNVTALEERVAEGLVAEGGRITALKLAGCEPMAADLVVDSTGRGSHSPQWLESLGFATAPEERVEVSLGYATRRFRRRPTDLNGDIAVIMPPTPEGKRGGVMLAQENDCWSCTLIAHFGNYPVAELNGFREFAKTLPAPYIHEVVSAAEPLCEGAITRFPASVRRHYERLSSFPEGFLVMGDGVSSFNPIYGQGMSSAALQAMELRRALGEGTVNLAKRFFAAAAKVIDTPWAVAVGNDLRMPETVGPRNAGVKLVNWYISNLHRAAHYDAEAGKAFLRVANLMAPPSSIMHPKIAARVFARNLLGRPNKSPSTPLANARGSESGALR